MILNKIEHRATKSVLSNLLFRTRSAGLTLNVPHLTGLAVLVTASLASALAKDKATLSVEGVLTGLLPHSFCLAMSGVSITNTQFIN